MEFTGKLRYVKRVIRRQWLDYERKVFIDHTENVLQQEYLTFRLNGMSKEWKDVPVVEEDKV
jgi:hypothetical protein